MENKFYAILHKVPLEIESLFFSKSDFSFSPLKEDESEDNILPHNISFSSNIQFFDESKKKFMVGVLIESSQNENTHTRFTVNCLCYYTWLKEDPPDEDAIKRIYNWAVAIQVGAIRQHIIQETAQGPFRAPYFLPITLVEIKEHEADESPNIRKKKRNHSK